MRFFETDDSHSVSGIRRAGTKGNYCLNWDSSGLQAFLVLMGNSESAVSLGPNVGNPDGLKKHIAMNQKALLNNRYLFLPQFGITAYVIKFSEMKQRGGFEVQERPGVYAVYGWSSDDAEESVFVPETGNIMKLTVEITIEQCPVMKLKGLFHKCEEYSGYHKVTVVRGVPDLESNLLYYTVDSNHYMYPFPNEIVSNGGSFYVKCAEGGTIKFGVINGDGIRIR